MSVFGKVNDLIGGAKSADNTLMENRPDSQSFLSNWIQNRLPEFVTGLATRVVDDGSGTFAKEAISMGTDPQLMGGVFR